MFELRKAPRINVTWRGYIRFDHEKNVPIRIVNISNNGLLLLSPRALMADSEFQLVLEVPHIDNSPNAMHQVNCTVVQTHSVLSGEHFRVGVKFVNVATIHRDLINAWVSLVSKFDPK
jgi:c-di-GMP-binding flagellar brake protein YcgR